MWIPKSIEIENLMTHVKTAYDFQQNIVTLFQGVNLDDDEQESNGAGKSVLIEGLSYAILGSFLKEKTIDADMIRNGEKKAYIRFSAYNTRSQQLLEIERELNLKTPSKVFIKLNSIDQKDKFATVPEGNKLILDLIGISRKDLLNYYIVSKEKYISFYSSSDTDKKEVIGRFSKSDSINGVEGFIQIKLNEFDAQITKLQGNITSYDAEIKIYNEQIETEKTTDREKLKTEQILQYQDQIVQKDYLIFDKNHTIEESQKNNNILTNQIKRYERIIGEYNRQLTLLTVIDYSKELGLIDTREQKVKLDETTKKKEKAAFEKELDESRVLLRDLETGLKGLIACPACSHEFIPDEDFDVADAKETKPIYEEGIKELEGAIGQLKTTLTSFNAKYTAFDKEREVFRSKIKEFQNQKFTIENKIKRCNNGIKLINDPFKGLINTNNTFIKNANATIATEKENIIKINDAIKALREQQIEDEITKIQAKIDDINFKKISVQADIKEVESEKFKNEQWIYNFTKFKSYLANKSIKNIEGLTNLMLKKMNSNLQIQLEGYGLINKGKELREKITPYILRDGFNEGSFFKFSGGEKGRIEISTISGVQQLINLNTKSGGLDLLWIDEVLESIDGRGIQSIARSARKLNKTIGLITHVAIPAEIDYRVIIIQKKNKISQII